MQMVTAMKENGWKIELVETVNIIMQMELHTKANGLMISSMDTAKRFGLIKQSILVTIRMVKSRVKVSSIGLMALIILEISIITILKEREYTTGQMEENMKENGLTIKCMEKGNFLGMMEGDMLVIMLKTRKLVKVNSFGQIKNIIKVIG